MSACSCEGTARARALAALAAAALVGCPSRSLDVRPFRLSATLPDGSSLATPGQARVISLTGTARRPDETTLTVEDATHGLVTLRFDRSGAPELAFPARLDGAAVLAEVFVEPTSAGPAGGLLPITGLRVATQPGAPTYEFALGETSAQDPIGGPVAPLAIQPVRGTEDLPGLLEEPDFRDDVPDRCGLAYLAYVQVFVQGAQVAALGRGHRAQVVIGVRTDPLTILNVVSYQRRGTCAGQSESWTQVAAWR